MSRLQQLLIQHGIDLCQAAQLTPESIVLIKINRACFHKYKDEQNEACSGHKLTKEMRSNHTRILFPPFSTMW